MLEHDELNTLEILHRGYRVHQDLDTKAVYLKRKDHIVAKMPCRRPLDEESLRVRVDCYIELLRICEMIEEKKSRERKEKVRGPKKKEKEKEVNENSNLSNKNSVKARSYFRM
ncbi:hypothetical protein [Lachnobacterium bovis]|uniref:Uncharacterized protein n=1 Tax=Lachnobacterium bovis TaxID=140626 RepID=A0A1H9TV76_9FIRM|nr:hypothetical protein [Lachnobacterium bovis]SES00898.1 hypothetical protein SAMN02910429_01778 [Lachnobacterium bovis]